MSALPLSPPDPMRPVPFRVDRVRAETHDTFTLHLRPPAWLEPFAFAPGQFNMLYAFGTGEVPVSLSGPPGTSRELLHTIRAVGSVTRALGRLRRGDQVGVRGPFGTPWPLAEARGKDVVIVAGGIGLAPLRPAVHELLEHRDAYGRIVLLYGARTPRDLLFSRDLESWRGRFDLDVQVIVDRAAPGWHGLVGTVTALIPRTPLDPEQTTALVCGPEIMMWFTVHALKSRGFATSSIFVSMERNMKCGIGLCGHCQLGPFFVCRHGPVFPFEKIGPTLLIREL